MAGGTTFFENYGYTAFGELYSSTGSASNRFHYTGQQFDAGTGLYNLRARFYDPGIGRFLSEDPHPINIGDPTELNRYLYVANNAPNWTDPSGLFSFGYTAPLVFVNIPTAYVAAAVAAAVVAVILTVIDMLDVAWFSKKKDIKKVNAVADEYGMSSKERKEFGKWIEKAKDDYYGRDLTMDELREEAEAFLDDFRGYD